MEKQKTKLPHEILNFPIQWTKHQKAILIGLYLIEKDFQEIADELNKFIAKEAHGYDTWPHRTERAVAFQCCNLGLISQENFNVWDQKRKNLQLKDRTKNSDTVKKKVFARDENKCIICGSSEKLCFSHIIPFRQSRLNLEIETITLCEDHHLKYDRNNDVDITQKIFDHMCKNYEKYREEYKLEETSCSIHGRHLFIRRKKKEDKR